MSTKVKVLIVEDSEDDVELALEALRRGGFDPAHRSVETAAALETALAEERWDAVISDFNMPGFTGMDALRIFRSAGLDIPFILMSGTIGEETAVEVMKAGASDYLMKANLARLAPALKRELNEAQIRAAHRRAQSDLIESERRFSDMLGNVELVSVMIDRDARTTYCNDYLLRLTGWQREEVIGRDWFEVFIPPENTALKDVRAALLAGRSEARHHENEILTRSGERRLIRWNNTVLRSTAGDVIGSASIGEDITEQKRAEIKITRLNRVYAVLSGINSLIVRARDREELFREACRIAVEAGAFRMAWIGVIDPQTLEGKVVAWHGGEQGYVDMVRLTARAGTPASERPASRAVRQLQPVICNDIATEPSLVPLRDELLGRGHKSVGCFPLVVGGRATAVITLFAGEAGVFDREETRLLLELTRDISFALNHIDNQERLRAAEGQFRGLVEQTIAGIYIIQDDKFVYVNPRYAEIFGYGSAEELIGRSPLLIVAEKDRDTIATNMRHRLDGSVASVSYEFTGLRRDGSTIAIGVHGARATHNGRAAIIGMVQDISEKQRAEEQIHHYVAQLENAFRSTVQVVTTLGEMRDPYTAGHQRRVAEIAVALGAELGFDARRQEGLRVAGYLHDIGKIRIPSEILSKPGRLSPAEYQLVQGHAQASYDVLKEVAFPWPVAEVALQHHERMDGSGYPQGLKAEAILLEARIMAVADVVEAMSSHRPYRAGLGIEATLSEIGRGRGSTYDIVVADACLKLFREKGYAIPA